jgi:putative sterol carrier protein
MAQTKGATKAKSLKGEDPTAEFFERLAARKREPLLGTTKGTLRFDLQSGKQIERWYVSVADGDISVSHKAAAADVTVRLDKSLFAEMAVGKANALAAALRGSIVPDGDLGLILQFQRLFPGPPSSRAARSSKEQKS